jgi:hypothetical protein
MVWMGITIGQWPIRAFGSEEEAKNWASDLKWESGAYEQRRIWAVAIPADTVTFSAEKIPARYELKQETP